MFNVLLFPDFVPLPEAQAGELALLKEMKNARNVTEARYVNYSLFNYDQPQICSFHVLTYPFEWITHYLKKGMTQRDPFMRNDFRRLISYDWTELRNQPQGRVMLDEMARFGIGNNLVSLVSPMRDNVCCAVTLSFEIEDDEWQAFRRANNDIHRFYAERLNSRYEQIHQFEQAMDLVITSREKECLYWVATGRTDEEIARRMGIGKWTVVSHIKSAKAKLGVRNRAAAVAAAISRDIITIKHGN